LPRKLRACSPALAAAVALALEPTAWLGLGTVSRTRDHPDKKLQDYLILAANAGEAFRALCEGGVPEPPGSKLPQLVAAAHKHASTNLALGSLFLLYYNVVAACAYGETEPERVAERAHSLLLRDSLVWLYDALRAARAKHVHPAKSSFWPDVTGPMYLLERRKYERSPAAASLKLLSAHDPVLREASEGFPLAKLLASRYVEKAGCRVPGSGDVDFLLLEVCSKRLDALAFRRLGLERAEALRRECSEGRAPALKPPEESLGSVADVAALALFYICLKCCEEWLVA